MLKQPARNNDASRPLGGWQPARLHANAPDLSARGIRRWHWLTILAGLTLAITFCMNMDGFQFIASPRSSGYSPLSLGIEVLREHASVPLILPNLSSFILPAAWQPGARGFGPAPNLRFFILPAAGMGLVVLPHLLGLLMALYSAAWLSGMARLKKTIHICGVALVVSCGLFIAVVFTSQIPVKIPTIAGNSALLRSGLFFIMTLVLCGVPLFVLIHGLLAVRRRSWAYLYHGFAGAAVALWLSARSAGGLHSWSELLGGVGLSLAAACVLLVARIGEARAIARSSWLRTLAYLLTLRLHKALPSPGLCPGCGYNLYGLRDMRCPECGRPFTFDELGVAPEVLSSSSQRSQRLSGE